VRDLTIKDATQRALLPYLAHTEALLAKAASVVSGRPREAEIVALADLGLATNANRMLGGFLTGALYRWESSVPMVPVDATVNVCGVSIHQLSSAPGTVDDYLSLVDHAARRCADETDYQWNLRDGNHFATLGRIDDCEMMPAADYLVVHASAAEYKRTPQGLYPTPAVWFADEIKAVDDGVRTLRYISGAVAERFIEEAHALVQRNETRHDLLAHLIAEELGVRPVWCLPHYGMPDDSSIAIGCYWLQVESLHWFPLLTEPEADVPLVLPSAGKNTVALAGEEHLLAPHGLGLESRAGHVSIGGGVVSLSDAEITAGTDVLAASATRLRSLRRDPRLLTSILEMAPGRVIGSFKPRFSYARIARSPHHA
jgi:hypothetical protein